jgi:tetratricopeptide (TPR) repeat protein
MPKRRRPPDDSEPPDGPDELKASDGPSTTTVSSNSVVLESRVREAQREAAAGEAALNRFALDVAVEHFTDAIALVDSDATFWAARSLCHASLQNAAAALEDAERCIALRPDWPTGYQRHGSALTLKGDLAAAEKAYEKGLRCFAESSSKSTDGQDVDANVRGDAQWISLQASMARLRTQLQDEEVKRLESMERSNPGRSGLCRLAGG